jgi:predicted ATPase/DNA-binding winged helix-turn-helix (wHTH) protein
MTNTEAPHEGGATEYLFGPFRFIPARRTLLCGGVPRRVGGRAIDILAALVERPSEPVSKRELMARVWPTTVVEEGNLKVHVAALRRALGPTGQGSDYISTVSGRGYCFVAPVRASAPPVPVPEPAPAGPGLPRLSGRAIGRDATIVALVDLVRQRRLVSIVGPAGIGKTVVGLAVAASCAAHHGMEACFADLGTLADPGRVAGAVAAAAGLVQDAGATGAALVAALREARGLLVLDSCDRVIDAVAVLAGQIVAGAPGMTVLCTSREPLRADGEHVHRLAALAVPVPGAVASATAALAYAAVELFVERATETADSFRLADADAEAVAEVCRRLEGNALAIELAATRVDAFGPRELAARLDDRFQLLDRGHRCVQARHRTLADALDWSYAYLPEAEQMLVRAVSVFAGPFTLDAAAALCRDGVDVASGLADLVAKSMLASERRAAVTYYRMPAIARAYALGKLEEHGEAAHYRRRHADVVCGGGDPR